MPMQISAKYRKWRRDSLRDRVITAGEHVRRLQVARSGVDGGMYPHDAQVLDAAIDRAEARHAELLNKFKETA